MDPSPGSWTELMPFVQNMHRIAELGLLFLTYRRCYWYQYALRPSLHITWTTRHYIGSASRLCSTHSAYRLCSTHTVPLYTVQYTHSVSLDCAVHTQCLPTLCSTHTVPLYTVQYTHSASLHCAVYTNTMGKYAAITPTTSMSTDTKEPSL